MFKCNYCDYEYESVDDLGKHLNATHTKCICGKVFDNKPNGYALCDECAKEDLTEDIDLTPYKYLENK